MMASSAASPPPSASKGMFGQFVALIEQADDADPSTAPMAATNSEGAIDPGNSLSSGDERDLRRDGGDREVAAASDTSQQAGIAGSDAAVVGLAAAADANLPIVIDAGSSASDAGDESSKIAPTVIDASATGGGGATTIARLSLRLATAEVASKRAETRARAAEKAAEELTQLLSAKDDALSRLVNAMKASDDEAVENAASPASADSEEARYEAMAALEGGNSDAAAEAVQFRQVVASQSQALDEAYEELKKHRAQIVAIEAAVAEVEASLHASHRERDAAVADARQSRSELGSSRKEVGRLSAKLGAMGATVDDLTAKNKAARTEVDTALSQILRRDNELSLLRQAGGGGSSSSSGGGGGPARSLRQDPLMQMVSTKGKWGSRAVGLADMLDVLMIRFGRLLRSNAMLRLIVMLYIVVLHVYVFNAAMVFLHHSGKMPDHMGDDVHDHLDHHLVH